MPIYLALGPLHGWSSAPTKKFYITIKCWAYRRVGVVGQLHKNKEHLSFFCRNKEKRAKFRWYRVSPLFIFFSVPTLKASWRSERFFAMQKSAPCATPGEMNYQWRLWLMNRAAAIKAATIVYVKDVEIDPSHPSMTYNLAQSSGIFLLFFCFLPFSHSAYYGDGAIGVRFLFLFVGWCVSRRPDEQKVRDAHYPSNCKRGIRRPCSVCVKRTATYYSSYVQLHSGASAWGTI